MNLLYYCFALFFLNSLNSLVSARVWKPSEIPSLTSIGNDVWVCDPDSYVSHNKRSTINSLLNADSYLKSRTSPCGYHNKPYQIAVLIIDEMESSFSASEFSETVFNRWGLGYAGADNGILVFVSVRDRELVITPGAGVTSDILSANTKQRIIDIMKPYLKHKKYGNALYKGTSELINRLKYVHVDVNVDVNVDAGMTNSNAGRSYKNSFGNEFFFGLLMAMVFGVYGGVFAALTCMLGVYDVLLTNLLLFTNTAVELYFTILICAVVSIALYKTLYWLLSTNGDANTTHYTNRTNTSGATHTTHNYYNDYPSRSIWYNPLSWHYGYTYGGASREHYSSHNTVPVRAKSSQSSYSTNSTNSTNSTKSVPLVPVQTAVDEVPNGGKTKPNSSTTATFDSPKSTRKNSLIDETISDNETWSDDETISVESVESVESVDEQKRKENLRKRSTATKPKGGTTRQNSSTSDKW